MAGISLEESEKKFTNHSARKTTVSNLKKANIVRSNIVNHRPQKRKFSRRLWWSRRKGATATLSCRSKRNYENPSGKKKQILAVSAITTNCGSLLLPIDGSVERKLIASFIFGLYISEIYPWIHLWGGLRINNYCHCVFGCSKRSPDFGTAV